MSENDYADFIAQKHARHVPTGHEPKELPAALAPFQRDITAWAVRKGRAAIFSDCGTGKTFMSLAWAREVPGDVLILAPLAVTQQTKREGEKWDIPVSVCRSQADVRAGINVTNYDLLEHFDPSAFAGVVLDESSILKSYSGSFRNAIIAAFGATPYRLACTATPSPNDYVELGNHAEFLGAMLRTEMLSMFFVHDGGETQTWRLKGHAEDAFWRWVCTWACMLRKPSDLGYSDEGYTLPPIHWHEHVVEGDLTGSGLLFDCESPTLMERRRLRRNSIDARIAKVAEIVATKHDAPWLLWCDLNTEADGIREAIPDAVDVRGSEDRDVKAEKLTGFAEGRIRVLVTKPKIGGFGMNWQHCANMIFVGLSDSYEALYQSTRRCWRFGQEREVNAHIVTSSSEGAVRFNVMRKEEAARQMGERMVQHMKDVQREEVQGTKQERTTYAEARMDENDWTMLLGDCVQAIQGIADASIDFTIFSPPFASLYTYSDSEFDMGNCKDAGEFAAHFAFLIPELLRVTRPGRLLAFHCMNLPTSKVRDGVIGLQDFRGDLIRLFVGAGWIYHSEVVIWKDPVTAMQRTKALGLLHKQIRKDSAMSRQGIPDYVVTMRAPGVNAQPIAHTPEEFPVSLWQRWASPVWYGINPSDTLQRTSAREEEDERHVCPLQLEVIRRCLGLWSNAGDLVLSPFAGIGSEGFEAVRCGRRFLGMELKRAYFDQACANLRRATVEKRQESLFA
mgnify:CR=1 FL=1